MHFVFRGLRIIDHICRLCISQWPPSNYPTKAIMDLTFASKRHLSCNVIFYLSFITFLPATDFLSPWGLIKSILITLLFEHCEEY